MRLRYLRAMHPAIAGGSVQSVQAVSSRAILSRYQTVRIRIPRHGLLQRLARKRPFPTRKGP
jgi:hypothetical protein